MKTKNIFHILAALVLVIPASCVREAMIEDDVQKETPGEGKIVTIRATMEQGLTKTALDESLDVVWKSGDQIKVYNADNPDGVVFSLETYSAGSAVGVFTGSELSGEGPFYACYPASAGGTLNGGAISINMPDVQKATDAGTFANGANITVGIAAELDEIYFRNVCGLVGITLKGDKSISKITITADYYDILSGTMKVTPLVSEAPEVIWTDYASSTLSLELQNTVALSQEGTMFYIVAPTGALGNGYSLEVQDSDGGAMVKHASYGSSNVIERSTIRPMPALDYEADCSAAWLNTFAPGIYTGVAPGETPSNIISSTADIQFAWNNNGAYPQTFRLQDWDAGYALILSMFTERIYLGSTFSADIKAIGNIEGLEPASGVDMKVVKKYGENVWITDGTHGFIMVSF